MSRSNATDYGVWDLDAFAGALPKSEYDPLQSHETDYFWGSIEPYFAPIALEDAEYLRDLDSRAGAGDTCLRIPPMGEDLEEKANSRRRKKKDVGNESDVLARLNSFPLTHRLVASLLDEGQGTNAVGVGKVKGVLPEDPPWLGVGEEEPLRQYQRILEERIKIELRQAGLLDEHDDAELVNALREKQWALRDVKLSNSVMRNRLYSVVVNKQLKAQVQRRERKRLQDAHQLTYLDRMSRSTRFNKRTRAKFNKLKNQLFPDHKIGGRVGARGRANGGRASSGKFVGGKVTGSAERRRKGRNLSKGKATRKSRVVKEEEELASGKPPESSVETEDLASVVLAPEEHPSEETAKQDPPSTGASEAASVAHTVAEIIKDAGGEAAKDHIIAEFIRRKNIPNEESTTSRTRRQVTSALSFSMRPYRFRKIGNGDKFALFSRSN